MAYQNSIPQPTDLLKNSQADILGNFAALTSFGNGYADLALQTIQPPTLPIANVNDNVLYSYTNPVTTTNELYVQKMIWNGVASVPTQVAMTASSLSNTSGLNGWSYLPSGLLIKWGLVPMTTATLSVTVGVTSGGPNFNQVFTIYVTPHDTSANTNFTAGVGPFTSNPGGNFSAYSNNFSATTYISYLVMGY